MPAWRLVLKGAELSFPSNCATPLAAQLHLDMQGVAVEAALDFCHPGPPHWDIAVETDADRLLLSKGGSEMHLGDDTVLQAPNQEYSRLYTRFETLVRERRMDVDVSPLRLVADAFLWGRHITVEPFVW